MNIRRCKDSTLKWIGLVAQLIAVLVAFIAGLSPTFWGLVVVALAATYAAYWIAEMRVSFGEAQKQPRTLSPEERVRWADVMRSHAGVAVRVYGVATDHESQVFGGTLIGVLRSAGMTVEPTLMLMPGDVKPDMAVFIDKSHESDAIGDAGSALIALVNEKQFVCFATSIPDPQLDEPKRVDVGYLHVHVGPRHFSLLPRKTKK